MALDLKLEAAIALHRFGLGPRPGSIAAIASDPRGALLAELDKPDISRVPAPGLRSSAEAMRALFDYRAERQARLKMARREAERQRDMSGAPAEGDKPMAATEPEEEPAKNVGRQIILGEAKARIEAAVNAELGLVERLVWFWSNHFCVSADKIL